MIDPTLRPYTLTSIQNESRGCFLLKLSVDHQSILYQSAGQYVQMGAPNVEPSFFAIANAPSPNAKELEFLIKASGPSASAITATLPNNKLLVSNAKGTGFALDKVKGRDLLLLTMGTGISALRPVLQSIISSRQDYGRVTLLHGARTENELPFFKEHLPWAEAQIDVRPVFSKQTGTRQGRIHAFIEEAISPNTSVLLSGSKDMSLSARAELTKHKIASEHILTNF